MRVRAGLVRVLTNENFPLVPGSIAPSQKADRAHTLEQLGAQVLYLDVCDGPALTELIGREKISHVLHMAAQV